MALEFLEFGRWEQLSRKVIATEIIKLLEKSNLDIKHCRQQGYDSASNKAVYITALGILEHSECSYDQT